MSGRNKMGKIPKFSVPLAMLLIPTLDILSEVVAMDTIRALNCYYSRFSQTLTKHLTSETELQVVGGQLTANSKSILLLLEAEFHVLQYKAWLTSILEPWHLKLSGQPIIPEVGRILVDRIAQMEQHFEGYIYKIQDIATKKMRAANNLLCKNVCNGSSKILNLTTFKISGELDKILANGKNFVPFKELPVDEIKDLIEKDLISASISFFRKENCFYPLVAEKSGLKLVLEQLISQSPSNSKQIEFYTAMFDYYNGNKVNFYDGLSEGHYRNNQGVQNLLPAGTILSLSDKGLGPCLLPIDWYIE